MESFRQEEQVNTVDIKELCVLCKSMPCCPEHCCNWDSCNCKDCENCISHSHGSHALQQQQSDPSILIKSTGTEEITKIKKSKDNKLIGYDDQDIKNKELKMPSEQTRAKDGALIINYEVPIEEDEEKVVLAGGIKGIRALRMQRDAINDQIQEDLQAKSHKQQSSATTLGKFSKYEESKR